MSKFISAVCDGSSLKPIASALRLRWCSNPFPIAFLVVILPRSTYSVPLVSIA